MKKIISKIKKIEKQSYPKKWLVLQDCRTIADVAEYCESTIDGLKIWHTDNGYCLISDSGEICDLAGKFKLSELFALKKYIWSNYDHIYMDCRSTSMKLIKKLGGKISNSYEYHAYSEKMVHIEINSH